MSQIDPESSPSSPDPSAGNAPAEWDDEQLRFLVAAGSILVASLDYEEVLGEIARLVVSWLADWCSISVLGPGGLRRVALACADPAQEPVAEAMRQLRPSSNAMSMSRRAIARGKSILVDSVDEDLYADVAGDSEYHRLMVELGPRSSLVVPMIVRDETRGAISLTMAGSGRRFTPQRVAIAEELCRRTALAVDNALLMRAARRRLNEVTTVQRVAQAITSDLRLDQICQTVVEQINRAFGYQMVSIYLREGHAFYLQSMIGYDAVVKVIYENQGVSGRATRSGEGVFVRDATKDPDFIFAVPDISQAIIIPLRYGGGPALGFLAVESNGSPVLDDDDFALLSLLADQVSVAVVNARLFARVEESAHRFGSLVESAGSVIVCTTPDLRITEFNREAERTFGASRDEVLGASYLERFVAPDQRERIAALAGAVLAGQPAFFEGLRHVASGEERTFVWNLTCRRDLAGAPAELMLVGQDITARKRAEEERLAIERKLQETQRLESLGVLAGGIAHDFNNLLASIIGNAGLLRLDLPPDTDAYRSAVEIEMVSQRAADLVRHMLVYAGRGRVHRQPTDLNTLVAETIVILRFSIRKDAILRQELAADLPLIEADASQVRQVVMNLIVNAAEALGDAGGTITITTACQMIDRAYLDRAFLAADCREGNYVVLTVSDTGVGMDASIRARIFDPFFTTKFTGRGLGLAAALGIMRSHQGAMRVDSEPGYGSTFNVLFPALRSGSGLNAPAPEAQPSAPLVRVDRTFALLADDEADVRNMAAQIIERCGYRVIHAVDGVAALELFARHHAKLAFVLLDMTMPRLDGAQTLRRMYEIDPGVPVLLMSGYTSEDLDRQFADVRPAALVQKPFSARELLAIIRAR